MQRVPGIIDPAASCRLVGSIITKCCAQTAMRRKVSGTSEIILGLGFKGLHGLAIMITTGAARCHWIVASHGAADPPGVLLDRLQLAKHADDLVNLGFHLLDAADHGVDTGWGITARCG